MRPIIFYFYSFADRNKPTEVPFMSLEEIAAVLEGQVCDCPEEILSELAEHLVR